MCFELDPVLDSALLKLNAAIACFSSTRSWGHNSLEVFDHRHKISWSYKYLDIFLGMTVYFQRTFPYWTWTGSNARQLIPYYVVCYLMTWYIRDALLAKGTSCGWRSSPTVNYVTTTSSLSWDEASKSICVQKTPLIS